MPTPGSAWLKTLAATVEQRLTTSPSDSSGAGAELGEVPWWSAILGVIGIGAHLFLNGAVTYALWLAFGPTVGFILAMSMLAVLVIGLLVVGRHWWALLALPLIGFLVASAVVALGRALLGWQ